MARSRIVIVGGGIAGLACAWELVHSGDAVDVTVLDAAARPGGKLRREPVAGVPIDVGAESVLARRPEALALMDEVGLGQAVVHPATTSARIWTRGSLHPMPRGTLMGVPSDPADALGVLTPGEVARAQHEQPWEAGELDDVSVGDYVGARLGEAVVDRLVEPLLGGVYAGRAEELSLRACLPQLWETARSGGSLTAAARAAAQNTAAGSTTAAPVFAGLDGGVGLLAETLTEQLRARGVTIRSAVVARELRRRPDGWTVVTGSRPDPLPIDAEAVVVAVPASPAARLLAPHAARAAAALREVEYASMAVVTLAVADGHALRGAVGGSDLPGSGFLVPPADGRTIKASTFSGTKWEWVERAGDGMAFLRASVGRHRETFDLQRADDELVGIAVAEVSEALGHQLPRVVDAHVQRWGGALPQYAVGHLDRVATVREDVARLPGLEVAGAAYEGVGIPVCIAGGRAAARSVTTHLRSRRDDAGQ
jgi:protoporphyrinogen/coproporphyrinogen III oxidase